MRSTKEHKLSQGLSKSKIGTVHLLSLRRCFDILVHCIGFSNSDLFFPKKKKNLRNSCFSLFFSLLIFLAISFAFLLKKKKIGVYYIFASQSIIKCTCGHNNEKCDI